MMLLKCHESVTCRIRIEPIVMSISRFNVTTSCIGTRRNLVQSDRATSTYEVVKVAVVQVQNVSDLTTATRAVTPRKCGLRSPCLGQ